MLQLKKNLIILSGTTGEGADDEAITTKTNPHSEITWTKLKNRDG